MQDRVSRRWVTDNEAANGMKTKALYHKGQSDWAYTVLTGIERHLLTREGKAGEIPEGLQVEHLAPQVVGREGNAAAHAVVDRLIHTAGNLGLLPAAQANQSAGKMRAQAKAHAFTGWANEHPLIGDFVTHGQEGWGVREIEERSEQMAEWACMAGPIAR